ncbi:type II secretion system F family protein [Micromonospora sp. CA-240977]|uniref:type II secretion system F family protein n=1 Tax=Micromonospora sp. CA-240977 TaxID=3239957 RepID=UPI003D8DD902
MTGATLLVAALLVVAAALVAWPVRSIRARRRRVLTTGRGSGAADPTDALVEWIRELGRAPDGPVEGPFDSPIPGGAVGMPCRPYSTAGRSGRSTALGWPSPDVTGSTGRPGATGGSAGRSRPAGPTRPPTRRDPRRPAGAAGHEAGIPDVERRGGASVAAMTIGGDDLGVNRGNDASDAVTTVGCGDVADGPGDTSGAATADGREGVLRWADRSVGSADAPRVAARRGVPLSSRRLLPLVGLLAGGVGAVVGGPVAAVAVGGYAALAGRAVLRWRVNRGAERRQRRGLDQLCGLAADLRAGLPAQQAIEAATEGWDGSDRLRQLTAAAVRLADRTGAPLAELVERIEADARATDRGLAAAAAQAAGARATAWLLAALPVGGIGLGYAIGVDPVAVLLHSSVGGVCAVVAVALQVVGLLWTERLGATPGRAG